MKLNNIEVSGITRVVIDRFHLWTLNPRSKLWVRETWSGDTIMMSGEEIADIVKAHTETEYSRVWVNGETINIETVQGAWKADFRRGETVGGAEGNGPERVVVVHPA